MPEDRCIREIASTIERWGRTADFRVTPSSSAPGWVTVRSAKRARSYPIGREAPILVSAEIRHGVFD
jgi:hypothetical protein